MTVLRTLIAAVILLVWATFATNASGAGLTYKAGIGYDYFSQQYFLDSLTNPVDSTLTRIALTSNFLNDVKGLVGLTYLSSDHRTLELRASYEQTPHLLRTKFLSDWRPKVGASRLEWHSELDWRDRTSGASVSGDTYILGSTTLRYKLPVGALTSLWVQGQTDGVYFYDNAAYSYNYYRGGGKIGLDRLFGDLNLFQVDAFVLGRNVPDSTTLSYFNGGIESSLFGTFGQNDLDLMTRFERKSYNQTGGQGDYTRAELDGRDRQRFGPNWFGRTDLAVDLTWYDPADLLNTSYQRGSVALLAGYEFPAWSLALGPELDILHEEPSDLAEREDYVELGGQASLDLLKPGVAVASLESVTGHRAIQYPTAFLTSYWFQRINLLADWTLLGHLNLNILGSAEWEWHSDPTNDNRLYLISTTLTYKF